MRVSVDSGRLMIVDPCYIGKGAIESGQLGGIGGTCARSVVIDSFGGDGIYNVVAKKDKNGKTERVVIYFCIEDYLAEEGSAGEILYFIKYGDWWDEGYRADEIKKRLEFLVRSHRNINEK